MKKFGRSKPDAAPPKPFRPVEISEQKCWKCNTELKAGQEAIAHTVDPIAFCVSCAGLAEPTRSDLVKAVVKGDPT